MDRSSTPQNRIDLIDAFVDYLRYERNYSARTQQAYREALLQYADFVSGADMPFGPTQIALGCVRAWMADMSQRGRKVSSVKRNLSALRSFCKYLRRQGLLDSNPLLHLASPRVPRPLPVWVTDEQMSLVLDGPEWNNDDFTDVRDRLILHILYQTGLRRAELLALRDGDVDLDRSELRVLGKGNKERIVPFGPELNGMLRHYIEVRRRDVAATVPWPRLLVGLKGEALSSGRVYNIVRARLQVIPQLAKRSPHVLRHSFATGMLRQDADLMAVKEIMGHASLDSTEVYTHLSPQELLKNYNQAHPRAASSITPKKKGD